MRPEQDLEQKLRNILSCVHVDDFYCGGRNICSIKEHPQGTYEVHVEFENLHQTVWLGPACIQGKSLNPLGRFFCVLNTLPICSMQPLEVKAYIEYIQTTKPTLLQGMSEQCLTQFQETLMCTPYKNVYDFNFVVAKALKYRKAVSLEKQSNLT